MPPFGKRRTVSLLGDGDATNDLATVSRGRFIYLGQLEEVVSVRSLSWFHGELTWSLKMRLFRSRKQEGEVAAAMLEGYARAYRVFQPQIDGTCVGTHHLYSNH